MSLSFMLAISIVFILLLVQIVVYRVSGFVCYTRMTSTCPDNVITPWNANKHVPDNLLQWIKSVTVEVLTKNVAVGKHCKTITVKKSDFFSKLEWNVYSPNVTILGKVNDKDVGADINPKQRAFIGPIWATINDQFEWKLENPWKNVAKAKLDTKAVLHNGLYYGAIDNDEMRIGKWQLSIFQYFQIWFLNHCL